MPYVKPEYRLKGLTPSDAGELNYRITMLCLEYLALPGTPPRYKDYNEVIGALECCKLEMYRRAVAPYEDKKIAENGDVYP